MSSVLKQVDKILNVPRKSGSDFQDIVELDMAIGE